MDTMTLTEFLLSRIAEDEARVYGIHSGSGDPDFFWGPDRIRAECEAKRRIVERYRRHERDVTPPGVALDDTARFALEDTMRDLAQTYADHPDYRQEWKP
jgi:hypothetical protein